MTGETHPDHHFCPPLRALDVFDHPSVPHAMARAARAGFGAISGCIVTSFLCGRGRYHTTLKLSPNGASITLTTTTVNEACEEALRLATQLGQEAA